MEKRKKIIKAVYAAWRADRISERAAALAFYSLISLVPLAVFGVALLSLFSGEAFFESQILSFGTAVFGPDALPFFERVLQGVEALASNVLYSAIGVLVLLYGASRLFVHLRRALHDIFSVDEHERGGVVITAVQERGVSLLYLILAFVLAVMFIVANVVISAFIGGIREVFNLGLSQTFFHAVNTVVTLVVVGGLYALLYRVGSRFELNWSHAFSGGLVASILFLLLNGVFAFYLQSKIFLSVFGASTFVIALLLWIYYGLHILFIGAEIADVYERNSV